MEATIIGCIYIWVIQGQGCRDKPAELEGLLAIASSLEVMGAAESA